MSNKELSFTNDEKNINKYFFLGLSAQKGVGNVSLRNLFDSCSGNFQQLQDHSESTIANSFRSTQKNFSSLDIARRIVDSFFSFVDDGFRKHKMLISQNSDVFFITDLEYPHRLFELKDSPRWIFIQGDKSILHSPRIAAVVGTREPTSEGILATQKATYFLGEQGCVILSGLATGIDETAHRTSLDLHIPNIAVLGHGIEIVFPSKTSNLRTRIVEQGGCLVSEYLPSDSYSRDKFIQRNRIQAALSHLLIISEGRSKSGTAHTLRFAQSLDRLIAGVAIDEDLSSTNKELLSEIAMEGFPVFSFGLDFYTEEFRGFIEYAFRGRQRSYNEVENIFTSVLDDIERITKNYSPSPNQLIWLKEKIDNLIKEIPK